MISTPGFAPVATPTSFAPPPRFLLARQLRLPKRIVAYMAALWSSPK
jgi:hypothetical protein